jgi:hypothetical protein
MNHLNKDQIKILKEIKKNKGNCFKNVGLCKDCPFYKNEGCEYVIAYILTKEVNQITDMDFLYVVNNFYEFLIKEK